MQRVSNQELADLPPQTSKPPTLPKRLRPLLLLQFVSVGCFVVALYFALYIINTGDWVGYSDARRNSTGGVLLTGTGAVARTSGARDSELTFMLVFNVVYFVAFLVVLVGTLRVLSLPVCRWKRDGYPQPPRSLGRLVLPSFYLDVLRNYNKYLGSAGGYEKLKLANTIVALENYDLFHRVLSFGDLLRDLVAHPGVRHLFFFVIYFVTVPVQIALAFATYNNLGSIDLASSNRDVVDVPVGWTGYNAFPINGSNAHRVVYGLTALQGVIALLIIQMYPIIALGELSDKGYAWRRFLWFQEAAYGERVFNGWGGPRAHFWYLLAGGGTVVYDVSELDRGGSPRAYLVVATIATRRDDAYPRGKLFSQQYNAYVARTVPPPAPEFLYAQR